MLIDCYCFWVYFLEYDVYGVDVFEYECKRGDVVFDDFGFGVVVVRDDSFECIFWCEWVWNGDEI